MDAQSRYLDIEASTLNVDIQNLKHCQLDYTQFSTKLFTLTLAAIGAVLLALPAILERNQIFDLSGTIIIFIAALICFSLSAILVYSLPIFAWIIIHKCRSIFRMISYLRILEWIKKDEHNRIKFWQGYEISYRSIRQHSWLKARTLESGGSSDDYEFWRKKMHIKFKDDNAKEPNEALKKINTEVNDAGVWKEENREESFYIGNYYEKLIGYISRLMFIALAMDFAVLTLTVIYAIAFYYFNYCCFGIKPNHPLTCIFVIGINIIVMAFAFYILCKRYYQKSKQNDRYILELNMLPFSQEAQFFMWCWALNINPREIDPDCI